MCGLKLSFVRISDYFLWIPLKKGLTGQQEYGCVLWCWRSHTALPWAMDLADCFLIDAPLSSTLAEILQSRIG